MFQTYTTRNEAVQREVIEPLGEYVADYDTEKLADKVIASRGDGSGFYCSVTQDEFWALAALCTR